MDDGAAMKLTDLEPHWCAGRVYKDGEWRHEQCGFTFLCPHCRTTRLFCQTIPMKMSEQMRMLAREHPDNGGDIVPAKQDFAWTIASGTDFADFSITPSIDASASGHWHGMITNGQIAR